LKNVTKTTTRPLSDDWRKIIEETKKQQNEIEAKRAAQEEAAEKRRLEALRELSEKLKNAHPSVAAPSPVDHPAAGDHLGDVAAAPAVAAANAPSGSRGTSSPALWSIVRRGEARYMIDRDPNLCLNRICQFALNLAGGRAKVKAKELFEAFRFDALYGDAQSDWADEFERVFDMLAQNQRGKGLLLFVVERIVRDVIPKSQLVYNSTSGTKRQDLQPIELAYVLKTIVSAVRIRGSKRAERLSRAYFLKPEYRVNYKAATRRQLNTGKLARITDLLHQHGFVEKVRRSKFAPLRFRLGRKASLIPVVPASHKNSSTRGRKEGQ
jgi:hypothetical protein